MQPKLKNLLIMLSIVFTLIGAVTAIMTLANLTESEPFFNAWASSFLFAFLLILPLGAVIFMLLNKLINYVFSTWTNLQKNLIQGILMALIMESIMAVVTTINNHGYQTLSQFSDLFLNSLLYALPVGLTFSFLMTLVIKPHLEKKLLSSEA